MFGLETDLVCIRGIELAIDQFRNDYNKRSRMNYYPFILYCILLNISRTVFHEKVYFQGNILLGGIVYLLQWSYFFALLFLSYLFTYLFIYLFRGIMLYAFIGSILHLPHLLSLFPSVKLPECRYDLDNSGSFLDYC